MILHRMTICLLLTLILTNYVMAQCTWKDTNPVLIRDCPNVDDPPYEADCSSVINYGGNINCDENDVWKVPNNGFIINLNDATEKPFNEAVTTYIKLRILRGSLATVPVEVFQMSKLTEIKISHNKLSKINFNYFLSMASLKIINVAYNNISVIDTIEVSRNYSAVNYIDVSNNVIEVLPNNFLGQFRNIEYLNLSHNMISNIKSHAFEGTVRLKTLDISHNRLHDLGNIFANLPKLHDPNFGPWINLGTLSKLVLDNNFINFVNFYDFFDTNISELSIGGNQIPCEVLSQAKYSNYSEMFDRIVTAVTLNCRSKNVNGISCQNYPNNTDSYVFAPDIFNGNNSPIIQLLKNAIENNTKSINNLVEIAHQNEKTLENIERFIETDSQNRNSSDDKLTDIVNNLGDLKKYFFNGSNLEEVVNTHVENQMPHETEVKRVTLLDEIPNEGE